MKLINLENWNRKEHFEFFSKMRSPYFGIIAEVDCANTYQKCKDENTSFFATYLHRSMTAVNAIKEFKFRIIDGAVYELDKINAGATISREDGTFGFIYVNYSEDFLKFEQELSKEIDEVKNSTGLRLNDDNIKIDLIRHSTLPWTNFTSILHPTNLDNKDSVPKITFGKFKEQDKRKLMPVSIEAHHGLVDGFHVSEYFKKFQELLDQ